MKSVKPRDYPVWVCYTCGDRHGFKKCGVCGEVTAVTEPRDFGHLKNSWLKVYAERVAIDELAKAKVAIKKDNLNTTTP